MKAVTINLEYFRDRCTVSQNGCWNWNGAISDTGYGSMAIKRVTISTHRAMYQLQHGPISSDVFVCHRCDNRLCCNPDHLFSGTQRDNIQDCLAKGRFKTPFGPGEKPGKAKLTNDQVKAIRLDGRPHRVIAAQYGVDRSTIGYAKSGKTWGHI